MHEIIIKALNTALVTDNARVTTEQIYNAIKVELGELSLAEFRPILSKFKNDGLLPGFYSSKGRFGGWRRSGADTEVSAPIEEVTEAASDETVVVDDSEDEESAAGLVINISPSLRISNTDKRNWAIQKKSGNQWLSERYYPDATSALKRIVKLKLAKKIKETFDMVSVKDLVSKLDMIESKILAELKAEVNVG